MSFCQCVPCPANTWVANNTDLRCKTCSTCAANHYISTACTPTSNTECSTCSTCGTGQYVHTACSTASNTECKTCSTCASDQYVHTACTPTSNTECKTCSTCAPNHYIATACTPTSNTECKACSTCAAHEFMQAPCTATKNATCTPCAAFCAGLKQPLLECTPRLATCGVPWTSAYRCLSGVWSLSDQTAHPPTQFGDFYIIKSEHNGSYQVYNVDTVANAQTALFIKDGATLLTVDEKDSFIFADVSVDHGKTFASKKWPVRIAAGCALSSTHNSCTSVQSDCSAIGVNDKYVLQPTTFTPNQ